MGDTIPGRIRFWRRYHRISQAELGRRAGLSTAGVSKIECGDHRPRVRTLRQLAVALDVSVIDLLPLNDGERKGGQIGTGTHRHM